MRTYHTIVIGLGAMGSAVAYQLARRGSRVLGIDQLRSPHAMGSTHGDTRITRLAIGEGIQYTPLALRSHELWKEVERETGRELLTVTGGLIISGPGTRSGCHVPGFFENTLAAASRFGIDHEVLEVTEIRNRFPQFKVRDDEVGYYEPGAGLLRPEQCVAANLELATRHGAAIQTDVRVTAIRQNGDLVEVHTEDRILRAEEVILSAGAWLPDLVEPVIGSLFRVTRQVLYWFEISQNPERFKMDRCPVFIWDRESPQQAFYGFPAIDGAAGGVKVATEQSLITTTPRDVDRSVHTHELDEMWENIIQPHLPDLSSRCLKAVTCLYTSTADSHFVIDRHPEFRRVLIVSPCSGHGFKHSAAIGEAVAELVLDGKSTLDLSSFTMGHQFTTYKGG